MTSPAKLNDKIVNIEAEIGALQKIVKALRPLDDDERNRVLTWAWDRWISVPGKRVTAMVVGMRAISGRE